MSKAQVNIRLRRELIDEVDRLVKSGRFSSKTEAFTEAVRLLIKAHKGELLAKRIDRIREGTEGYPSPTEAVVSAHEEEDETFG
ncbi:MAG: ribbon-helix-helix domain-containing protein [Candidatus Bathyarchaeia archaeon]